MALEFCGIELPRDNFTLKIDTVVNDDITGIFGHSGAGKTSLLHLISGLERPAAGRLSFNGRVLVDVANKTWVPPHKRRIGMVFQHSRLFPHMNVRKNLLFGRQFLRDKSSNNCFDEVVKLLELETLLDSNPLRISGGESQRVALGRALLCAPELLLLDEPFSAVDFALRRQILPFLWRIRAHFDIPMLVISHDLPDILQLTDKLILLGHGRLTGHGSLRDLVSDRESFGLLGNSGLVSVFDLEIRGFEDSDTMVLSVGADMPKIYSSFHSAIPVGSKVKASIAPEDVLLSLSPLNETSARNIVPGTVVEILENPGRTLCQVDIGAGSLLLAEITHSSFLRLGIKPGSRIYCLFKANAIDITVA